MLSVASEIPHRHLQAQTQTGLTRDHCQIAPNCVCFFLSKTEGMSTENLCIHVWHLRSPFSKLKCESRNALWTFEGGSRSSFGFWKERITFFYFWDQKIQKTWPRYIAGWNSPMQEVSQCNTWKYLRWKYKREKIVLSNIIDLVD